MSDLTSVTGPFVASAASAGVRPPHRLIDHDVRGWIVVERDGDRLVLDQYGDLWWTREAGHGDLRVIRSAWPEETASLSERIEAALSELLTRPAR